MENTFALVGFFEILMVFFMQWEIYTKKIITTFSIASYVIAIFLFYLGLTQSSPYVITLSIITAAVRGFFIPWYMKRRIVRDHWREREIKPVISTAMSIVISLLIVVFAYVLYRVTFYNSIHLVEGSIPMALLLQGAFLIVSRRNAFIQLIGYMMMENALFLFEGYLFPGLPFIVEAGIVLDLIGIIAVAGVVVRMMKDSSTDANEFDELKG
jgi:hydrogenase-4 component E